MSRMARELETSVRGLLSRSRVVSEIENASDIVVLLTRHVLDDDSRSFNGALQSNHNIETLDADIHLLERR